MLRKITFNRQLWHLTSFDTIGYDKETKKLIIYLFNHTILTFHSIHEEVVFQFIVEKQKEKFIENHLKSNYYYSSA